MAVLRMGNGHFLLFLRLVDACRIGQAITKYFLNVSTRLNQHGRHVTCVNWNEM